MKQSRIWQERRDLISYKKNRKIRCSIWHTCVSTAWYRNLVRLRFRFVVYFVDNKSTIFCWTLGLFQTLLDYSLDSWWLQMNKGLYKAKLYLFIQTCVSNLDFQWQFNLVLNPFVKQAFHQSNSGKKRGVNRRLPRGQEIWDTETMGHNVFEVRWCLVKLKMRHWLEDWTEYTFLNGKESILER